MANEEDKCKRFGEGLRTDVIAAAMTYMDWSDFSKLVEVAMRDERFMANDKKNKISKKDPYGQSLNSLRGDERHGETMRQMLDIQQQENFKTHSHNPSGFRTSYGGFQRHNRCQEKGGTLLWTKNVPQ